MIPKIIHQVWIGPRPVPNVYIDSWRALARKTGWEHRLWTDKEADEEVRFSREVYQNWNLIHGKADLYRLEVLYRHGGLYFDADYVANGCPLEHFIPLHADLVGTTEHDFPPPAHFDVPFNPRKPEEVPMSILIQCGFLGARPRHPQIRHWLETAVEAYHAAKRQKGEATVGSVEVAGAYHISRHIQHPITILPFQWFLGRSDSFARYFDKYPE